MKGGNETPITTTKFGAHNARATPWAGNPAARRSPCANAIVAKHKDWREFRLGPVRPQVFPLQLVSALSHWAHVARSYHLPRLFHFLHSIEFASCRCASEGGRP